MKLELIFKKPTIDKFTTFLTHIFHLSLNSTPGIFFSITPTLITVIYDYQHIHSDYKSLSISYLNQIHPLCHYFTYKLSPNTITSLKIISTKTNDTITLRISLENLKKLIQMIRESQYASLILTAEKNKQYSKLNQENESSKYKAILTLKDGNGSIGIMANYFIYIKALRQEISDLTTFCDYNKKNNEELICVMFKIEKLLFLCKYTLEFSERLNIHLYLNETEDLYELLFVVKKFKVLMKLKKEEEKEEILTDKTIHLVISPDDLIKIVDKQMNSHKSEGMISFLRITNLTLEIIYRYYLQETIENNNSNNDIEPYSEVYSSIPIRIVNDDEEEEEGVNNFNENN